MYVLWKYKWLCSDNRAEQTIGHSWTDGREIMSRLLNFSTNLYGVTIMLCGEVVNIIFCTTLVIFFKRLQMYSCDGFWYRATGLNQREPPRWLLQDQHISLWQSCIFLLKSVETSWTCFKAVLDDETNM